MKIKDQLIRMAMGAEELIKVKNGRKKMRKIRDQKVLKETDDLLGELVASYYADFPINHDEKDKMIELRQRLNRLCLDIQPACDVCDVKSCPWRPDPSEECIYYREMKNNEFIG